MEQDRTPNVFFYKYELERAITYQLRDSSQYDQCDYNKILSKNKGIFR